MAVTVLQYNYEKGIIFMREELLKGLSEEQIAKIKGIDNARDLLQLAKDEGVELSNEQLEAVSGGNCDSGACPDCGCYQTNYFDNGYTRKYYCAKCGKLLREGPSR